MFENSTICRYRGRFFGIPFYLLVLGTFSYVTASSALVGKLCLSASYAVVFIHSGEIFPTTIRSSAMGLVSGAAR